jgi:hypothetical protein
MKFAEATNFHRKSGERGVATCCSLHQPPDAHGSDALPFVIPSEAEG